MLDLSPSPPRPALFSSQFSKDVLVNIYSAYIDNFLNAKDAVRIAKEARPAFMKFLEVGPGSSPHRCWPRSRATCEAAGGA